MENNTPFTPIQRFFRLLQLDKRDIYYVYVYGVFAGLINLSLPLGIQAVIGLIAGGSLSASLILLVAAVTVATALSGVLVIMQLTVTETIQRRIFARSAFEFAYRIPRLRLSAMTRIYGPELVNRFFDTLTVQKGIPKILIDLSTAALSIIFGLILIAFYHPFFAFFGLSLIIVLFIIFTITGPRGLSTSLRESKYKYEVAHWLEELARTMNTFKLWGDTPLSLKKTDYLVCNYLDNRHQHFRILLTQYSSILAFKVVVTASLLFLGSFLVIDNQINIGQFVAAEIVVILMLSSVEKLILSMDVIYDMLTALEKLGNVTDLPLDENEGLRFEEIDTGKGITLEVRDLYFKYEDAELPTIDHLSMSVSSGERVCITGYNRSGKSTLIQIIAGLYGEFQGSISYNGIPMRNIELSSLRRHIGDYCSEEDLFKGTVLENISLGNPDITMDQIVWAVNRIGLSEYIKRLPNGYNTVLLPAGKNVPQSVRTKIILARSLAKKPRLHALEGFWASLEPEDREAIATFLMAPEHDWTLLIVSDDPIIASKCDRVLIIKDGKIVKAGSFEEIQQSPHFRKVFKVAEAESLHTGNGNS
jgi:ABC-type bacteriocin/lantibiotic exporter with double-glycine peptidase domain